MSQMTLIQGFVRAGHICEQVWQFICNVKKSDCFTEENVAENMDNIRDHWNKVNSKSYKQTFIEKRTPYCMHKWSFNEWVWCGFLSCHIVYEANNECLWVQWYKYFHEVKDEMFHSSKRSQVEWYISSSTKWKYLFHCTNKKTFIICFI